MYKSVVWRKEIEDEAVSWSTSRDYAARAATGSGVDKEKGPVRGAGFASFCK